MNKIKDIVVKGSDIASYTTTSEYKSMVAKRSAIERKMSTIKITNKDERMDADDYLTKIRLFRKAVTSARDEILKPIKQLEKEVKGYFAPVEDECKVYENQISEAIIAQYNIEQAELAELKEKEQKKVESGYQKEETALDKIEEKEEEQIGRKMKGSRSSIVEQDDCEVTDINMVPEKWLVPREIDKKKVLAALKADPELEIEGIKRTKKQHMRVV